MYIVRYVLATIKMNILKDKMDSESYSPPTAVDNSNDKTIGEELTMTGSGLNFELLCTAIKNKELPTVISLLQNDLVRQHLNKLSDDDKQYSPLQLAFINLQSYSKLKVSSFKKFEWEQCSPQSSLDLVKVLIEAGADINFKSGGSNPIAPVVLAAEQHHLDVLWYFLQNDCLKMDSQMLNTVLEHICNFFDGDDELKINCVSTLLEFGGDPHTLNAKGETPFYLSVKHEKVFRKLLESKLERENIDLKIGSVLSRVVEHYDDVSIVEHILETGCDVNSGDTTPLMIAADRLHAKVIQILLEYGANVNACNSSGKCAGIFCLESIATSDASKLYVFKLLLDAGLNIDREGGKFLTSLFDEESFDIECFKYLVNHGFDVNNLNDLGANVLHLTYPFWDEDILKVIFDTDVNINQTSSDGQTPLMLAVIEGNPTLIKMLLARDCDINRIDNQGISALGYAYKNDFDDNIMLTMLLEAGADVDQLGRLYYTSDLSRVHALLHYGANTRLINIRTKNGNLLVAEYLNYCDEEEFEMVKCLICFNCSLSDLRIKDSCDEYTPQMMTGEHALATCDLLYQSGAPKSELTQFLDNELKGAFETKFREYSLKSLCRRIIRLHIGLDISRKVVELNVPDVIQDYIMMTDKLSDFFEREGGEEDKDDDDEEEDEEGDSDTECKESDDGEGDNDK